MKTRVYTPEPMLNHPGVMIKDLFGDLIASRELAWRLFMRDLKSQFRQTYFGYVWAFLPPLVSALTFIYLQSQGIVKIEGTGIPYPAFVMIGTALWQVFVEALTSPCQSLTSAKSILVKINFPREAILLAGFYMVLFNFLIRLILIFGVMLWWQIPIGAGILFFPVAVASLMICGSAIGLAIAPLGGLYGDVTRGIPIIAQFWMLLTPVVYPARTDGLSSVLTAWNPVSPLIITARECLTNQPFSMLPGFFLVTLASVGITLIGLIGFRIAMPHLIARMGG